MIAASWQSSNLPFAGRCIRHGMPPATGMRRRGSRSQAHGRKHADQHQYKQEPGDQTLHMIQLRPHPRKKVSISKSPCRCKRLRRLRFTAQSFRHIFPHFRYNVPWLVTLRIKDKEHP